MGWEWMLTGATVLWGSAVQTRGLHTGQRINKRLGRAHSFSTRLLGREPGGASHTHTRALRRVARPSSASRRSAPPAGRGAAHAQWQAEREDGGGGRRWAAGRGAGALPWQRRGRGARVRPGPARLGPARPVTVPGCIVCPQAGRRTRSPCWSCPSTPRAGRGGAGCSRPARGRAPRSTTWPRSSSSAASPAGERHRGAAGGGGTLPGPAPAPGRLPTRRAEQGRGAGGCRGALRNARPCWGRSCLLKKGIRGKSAACLGRKGATPVLCLPCALLQ